MSGITDPQRFSINFQSMGSVPPINCLPQTHESAPLPRSEPFLSDDEVGTTKENINFAAKNSDQICKTGLNSTLYKSAVERIGAKVVSLSDEAAEREFEWLEIKPKDEPSIFVHFDKKNSKISFFNSVVDEGEPCVHSYINDLGEVDVELFLPLYSSYSVEGKSRLKDSNLFSKIKDLNNLNTAKEIKEALICYFHAKEEKIDSPEKNPLLYRKATLEKDEPLDVTSKFLAIALWKNSTASTDDIEKFSSRLKFLSKLDQFTKDLEIFLDQNYPRLEELQKLDELKRSVQLLGGELDRKKALTAEERASLLHVLKRFDEKTKEKILSSSNGGEILQHQRPAPQEIVFTEPYSAQPIVEERLVENDLIDDLDIFDDENLPVATTEASDGILTDFLEQVRTRHEEVKRIQGLCSNLNTFAEGLKELNVFIENCNRDLISKSEILRAIALCLPLLKRDYYKKLSQEKLDEADKELRKIASAHYQASKFNPSAEVHLRHGTEQREHEDLIVLSSQLVGYHAMGVFCSKDNKTANDFTFEPFLIALRTEFFSTDIEIQKKAADVVEHYFKENKISTTTPLTALSNFTLTKEDKKAHAATKKPSDYFFNKLGFICKKAMTNEQKVEYRKLWQKIDFSIRMAKLVELHMSRKWSDTFTLPPAARSEIYDEWVNEREGLSPFVEAGILNAVNLNTYHALSGAKRLASAFFQVPDDQIEALAAAVKKITFENPRRDARNTQKQKQSPSVYGLMEPKEGQLEHLFLIRATQDEKNAAIGDLSEVLTPAARALIGLPHRFMMEEKNLLNIFSRQAEGPHESFIESIFSKAQLDENFDATSIAQNEFDITSRPTSFFQPDLKKDINRIASARNDHRGSSNHKEFEEIFTESRDTLWKTFSHISKFPESLAEVFTARNYYGLQTKFDKLLAGLYQFQGIEHIAENERAGVHHLISKEIPQKINQAITQLVSKINDDAALNEEIERAAISLSCVLLLSHRLKSYLEKYNENLSGHKIDLSDYENYLDLYAEHLSEHLPQEVSKITLVSIADQLFKNVSEKDLSDASPKVINAILHYRAVVHFNSSTSLRLTPKSMWLQSLKNHPNYSEKVLAAFFQYEKKSEVPQGLRFDAKRNLLRYQGQTVDLQYIARSFNAGVNSVFTFTKALERLKVPMVETKWYLGNFYLNDFFSSKTGKPLSSFSIVEEGGFFKLEHTPFSFDQNEKIYFELDHGLKLKFNNTQQNNPLRRFGLESQFHQSTDLVFQDGSEKRTYIIRDNKPLYWIEEHTLVRVKDSAITLAGETLNGFILWREKGKEGGYEAKTAERNTPDVSFNLVGRPNHPVRFESKDHPGFYLSNKKPICRNFDLSSLPNHVVLENDEGELLLIASIDGKNVEAAVLKDALQTSDPWDLFMLLSKLDNLELAHHHFKTMKLNPPKDEWQKSAADTLHAFVMTKISAEAMPVWLYALNLDLSVRGNKGGLAELDLTNAMPLLEAYSAYKSNCALYPELKASKEIERLFLIDFKRYIASNEESIEKQIKELKKAGVDNLKRSPFGFVKSALHKVYLFPNPNLVQVLEQKLMLAAMRGYYRKLVRPTVEQREAFLQTGVAKKSARKWKKLTRLELIFKKETETKNVIAPLANKILNELSATPDFTSWSDLKNGFNGLVNAKEEYVLAHIVDFYQAANTFKGAHKKELLEWLELSPSSNEFIRWLAKVATNPGHYKSIPQLIRYLEKYNAKIKKLTESADKYQAKIDRLWGRPTNKHSHIKDFKNFWFSIKRMRLMAKATALETNKEKNFLKVVAAENIFVRIKKKALLIFKVAMLLFKSKSLKIKNITAIERPYNKHKKLASLGSLSVINPIDQAFDEFFDQCKNELMQERTDVQQDNPRRLKSDKKVIQDVQAKVDTYRKREKSATYTLKPGVDLNAFQDELNEKIDECKQDLKEKERTLLFLANSAVTHSEQLKKSLKGRPLEWKDLNHLVYKGQEWAYYKHLADPSKIDFIRNGFYEYLAIRTRLYQMERISRELNGFKEGTPTREQEEKLGALLSEKRAYPPKDGKMDPKDYQLLFFEAASPNGMFKEEQYKKIQELSQDGVTLSEMPTGFGKTDYIIPMLNERIRLEKVLKEENALKAASKSGTLKRKEILKKGAVALKKLALNIWPDALHKINKSAIERKTAVATGGGVQLLSFSRTSELDSTNLERLYYRLQKAIEKGESISVRASDLASIRLHWIENMEKVHRGDATGESLKCVEFYAKIVKTLISSGSATIDESHDILDPMQKTIYTLGYEQKVPGYAIDFSSGFFKLLSENEAFNAIISENKKLTPDDLDQKIKEVFNEQTLRKIANFLEIEEVDIAELEAFLKGQKEQNPAWRVDKAKLYLAAGYYKVIVNAALSGCVRENFGFSVRYYNSCQYAIPYAKKDLPKESEDNPTPSSYQNSDETILKTIRCYVTEGLSKENLADLIANLVASFREEKERNPHAMKNELPSYKLLNELFGKAEIPQIQLEKLLKVSTGDFETRIRGLLTPQAVVKLKNDFFAISQFVKHVAAEMIKIYPLSIAVTPQDLLEMLKDSVSVSATPQAEKVHSLRTKFVELAFQSGKMFDILLNKIVGMKKIPPTDEAFIQELSLAIKERGVRAVSDPSGIKELNYQFALKLSEEIKKIDAGIKNIVYFDVKQDKFVRFDVHSKTLHPFDLKSHKPDSTLTLYDQARSVGTNIFQSPNAKMVVLLTKATTAPQAAQACGRMRQLDGGQRIEAWTTENLTGELDEDVIQTIESLVHNQLSVSLQKNKVSFEQMMASDLKGALVRKMLGIPLDGSKGQQKELDVNKMMRLFSQYRSELIDENEYDPIRSYGSIGAEKPSVKLLQECYERLSKKAEMYLSKDEKSIVQGKLNKYSSLWKEVPLPEKDYGFDAGATQEISAELAVQQDVAVEVEVEHAENIFRHRQQNWENRYVWPKTATQLFNTKFTPPSSLEKREKIAELQKQINEIDLKRQRIRMRGRNSASLNAKRYRLESKIRSIANAQFMKKGFKKNEEVLFFKTKDMVKFEMSSKQEIGTAFFDDNFMLSSNFSDQLNANPTVLMGSEQAKPLTHILLILDTSSSGKKHYKAICIDANDASDIHSLLEQDRASDANSESRKIAIYSLDMNQAVDQGKNRFTEEELASRTVFALSAQAKLIAGNTRYHAREKDFFEKRIIEINILNPDVSGKVEFESLAFNLSPKDKQVYEKGRFRHMLEI